MPSDFSDFVNEIWRHQPALLVLLAAGFVVFVLLVIDTHRHRRKRKKERPAIKRRQ